MCASPIIFERPCAHCGESVRFLTDSLPNTHWDHMSSRQRFRFCSGSFSDVLLTDSLLHSSRGLPWLELMLSEARQSIRLERHRTNDMSGCLLGTVSFLEEKTEMFETVAEALLVLWPIVGSELKAEEEFYLTLTSGLGTVSQLSNEGFSLSAEMDFLKVVATIPQQDIAVPASVLRYSDELRAPEKPVIRTAAQRKRLYLNGLAESALSTLALLFTMIPRDIEGILLNLMVDDIDRATGRNRRYCTLSVQVTRAEFEALDLRRVEPVACLKSLKAVVPSSRTEVTPVQPIIEFDETDRRLVEADDLVAVLRARPT